MIRSSKKLLTVSIVFFIFFIIFLLLALFAPLSYEGNPISAPNAMYYISKTILYLIAFAYLIFSIICILYYINRKLIFNDGKLHFINFIGVKKSFDPLDCEIKLHSSRFDLLYKQKKVCSFSFLNDGDIFSFIKQVDKKGVAVK